MFTSLENDNFTTPYDSLLEDMENKLFTSIPMEKKFKNQKKMTKKIRNSLIMIREDLSSKEIELDQKMFEIINLKIKKKSK